jgi:hypothetical protein
MLAYYVVSVLGLMGMEKSWVLEHQNILPLALLVMYAIGVL